MKTKKVNLSETNEQFSMVPTNFLNEILEGQNRILEIISENGNSESEGVGDFITEIDAKRMLGRKTTWFWNLRKEGKLSFRKVGNKIFYKRGELIQFIESHNGSEFNNIRKGKENV